jgi:pyridoxal phosphate enzyme (YggS family)
VNALAAQVAERLDAVRARIAHAGGVGVDVLAVTKTFGIDAVVAARDAGCRAIGENYAQEVVAKFGGPEQHTPDGLAVHFIGQLQSNKVRQLAPLVDVWETVDRRSLVTEIAKRAPGAAVLVQVATSLEPGKGGCPIDDVAGLVAASRDAGLDVRGLMTVGPTTGGAEAARPGFRAVRRLVDELRLTVCSMGMSADLDVAVEEGSTEVRVGSALFGARSG